MILSTKKESLLLFLGDMVVFYGALVLMFVIRYGTIDKSILEAHLLPFTILFATWYLVYFIAGLYEKHTLLLKQHVPSTILHAQLLSSAIAAVFFYFIPYFGITPKTNLFIHLVLSFLLMLAWRRYLVPRLFSSRSENAFLIGSGREMKELLDEVNGNKRYGLNFVSSIDIARASNLDFKEEILNRVYSEQVTVVVADFKDDNVVPILPHLYNLIFSRIKFIDMHKVYESVFDREPLSLLEYSWFLENISALPRRVHDILKRCMDIVISLVLLVPSVLMSPVITLMIWLDDNGPIFFTHRRVGKNNASIRIYKFRTMSQESDERGKKHVTRVGRYLRAFRIDELPQLWNVLKGELSLIGPRPEIPELVTKYEAEIPYYNVRHLITPGLSGWAQIYHEGHPHHDADVPETKMKLAYDLYYIKNRSLMLDVVIALKTLNTIFTRKGR